MRCRGRVLRYRGRVVRYRGMVLRYRGRVVRYRGRVLLYSGTVAVPEVLRYGGKILRSLSQTVIKVKYFDKVDIFYIFLHLYRATTFESEPHTYYIYEGKEKKLGGYEVKVNIHYLYVIKKYDVIYY